MTPAPYVRKADTGQSNTVPACIPSRRSCMRLGYLGIQKQLDRQRDVIRLEAITAQFHRGATRRVRGQPCLENSGTPSLAFPANCGREDGRRLLKHTRVNRHVAPASVNSRCYTRVVHTSTRDRSLWREELPDRERITWFGAGHSILVAASHYHDGRLHRDFSDVGR